MNIKIADANDDHLDAVNGLVHEWGYAVTKPQVRLWLEAILQSPNHAMFVGFVDALAAGWLVVERRISLDSVYNSEITGLVVGADFRRLGVGQRLVSAAEDWSQARGLSSVVVRSNITRVESHEFYPSLGYELKKTSRVYAKRLHTDRTN